MSDYTETMVDINWPNLKIALFFAANDYLKNPNVTKTSDANFWQFLHGKTGKFRAENLKRLVDPKNEITDDELFILFGALCKSSSKLLKRYIAIELLRGHYESTTYEGSDTQTIDNLTSPVFSQKLLSFAKTYATSGSSSGETYMRVVIDKMLAIEMIWERLMRASCDTSAFHADVAIRLKSLEKMPVELDVQMYASRAASF